MAVQLFDANNQSCFTDGIGVNTWTDASGNFLLCTGGSVFVVRNLRLHA